MPRAYDAYGLAGSSSLAESSFMKSDRLFHGQNESSNHLPKSGSPSALISLMILMSSSGL